MATQTKKNQTPLKERLFSLAKIPMEIREVSLSLFLFTIGWGLGGDTFFSVYIKKIIDYHKKYTSEDHYRVSTHGNCRGDDEEKRIFAPYLN